MHPLSRSAALALVTLPLAIGSVQAAKVEDAVYFRQGVMNVFSWNVGHMAAMAKGEVPFDAAAFQVYAADLAAAAALNLLPGFPEESTTDDSDAKDEIWLNWAHFEARLQDLRTESAKLKEVAAGGDEAATKAQLDATRRTCKACHDDYKQ